MSIGDTPIAVILASLLNRVLWAVGIHGGNIVSSVGGTIWQQMVAANQEAFAATQSFQGLPYTFTSLYMDNYIWTGLFPLALVTTKSAWYSCIACNFIQYWRTINFWYSNHDEPSLNDSVRIKLCYVSDYLSNVN